MPLAPRPPLQVLASLPVQRLRRSTLFVDVLSVKEFPKRLLLRQLPREVDVLCTHPMFGPDSGALGDPRGWWQWRCCCFCLGTHLEGCGKGFALLPMEFAIASHSRR